MFAQVHFYIILSVYVFFNHFEHISYYFRYSLMFAISLCARILFSKDSISIDCHRFGLLVYYVYRRHLSPTFIADYFITDFQNGYFIVYAAQFLRSAHDADFVAVFVNVRAVFTVIWTLVFQPTEALHIDHIAGLQISDRLRRGGYGSRFRSMFRFGR